MRLPSFVSGLSTGTAGPWPQIIPTSGSMIFQFYWAPAVAGSSTVAHPPRSTAKHSLMRICRLSMGFCNWSWLAHTAITRIILSFSGWCSSGFKEAYTMELPSKTERYSWIRSWNRNQSASLLLTWIYLMSLSGRIWLRYSQFSNQNGLSSSCLTLPEVCIFKLLNFLVGWRPPTSPGKMVYNISK